LISTGLAPVGEWRICLAREKARSALGHSLGRTQAAVAARQPHIGAERLRHAEYGKELLRRKRGQTGHADGNSDSSTAELVARPERIRRFVSLPGISTANSRARTRISSHRCGAMSGCSLKCTIGLSCPVARWFGRPRWVARRRVPPYGPIVR